MSREEAAAKAVEELWFRRQGDHVPFATYMPDANAALAAADAHDLAHGVHRLTIDDATVERAARAWVENGPVEATWEGTSDRHKTMTIDRIRAVLAAAVQEER